MRFKLFSTCVDQIEFDIGMMSTTHLEESKQSFLESRL